jgi:tetratricopeptide (TPR) repeat protein
MLQSQTVTTRLRWKSGQLYFVREGGAQQQRGCSIDELTKLASDVCEELDRGGGQRRTVLSVGKRLYQWLDGDGRWLEGLTEALVGQEWRFEVEGQTRALAALPWEVLARADGSLLATRDALFVVVRRIDGAMQPLPPGPSPVEGQCLTLLCMAAAPDGAKPLQYEAEERRILDAFPSGPRSPFVLVEDSGTLNGLSERATAVDRWSIVHVSAHGSNDPPRLAFEDESGKPALVDGTALANALRRGNPPSVIACAACSSASSADLVSPSLVEQLVNAGVPASLGFAVPVEDGATTDYCAEVYREIALQKSPAVAVALVRQRWALDPDRDATLWSSARIVERVSVGSLVPAGSLQRPREIVAPPVRNAFAVIDRVVAITHPAHFVGRRREVQRLHRALRDGIGALVHGPGGLGKTSLVGRVLSRLENRTLVVLSARSGVLNLTTGALLSALLREFEGKADVAELLSDASIQSAQVSTSGIRALLISVLRRESARSRPVVFVLDDAESTLDNQFAAPTAEALSLFRAVIGAVEKCRDDRHRVILTSRYRFRAADELGRDLVESLDPIALAAMGEVDLRKALRQLDRYDDVGNARGEGSELPRELRDRILGAAGGSPRLLKLLASLARASEEKVERALDSLAQYRANADAAVADEAVATHVASLVIERLREVAGPAALDALDVMGLFTVELRTDAQSEKTVWWVAVPVECAAHTADVDASVIKRLVALSLLEQQPGGDVVVSDLVRPTLSALSASAREERAGRTLDRLPFSWVEQRDLCARSGLVSQLARASGRPIVGAVGTCAALFLRLLEKRGGSKQARFESLFFESSHPVEVADIAAVIWEGVENDRSLRWVEAARNQVADNTQLPVRLRVIGARHLVREGDFVRAEAELHSIATDESVSTLRRAIAAREIARIAIHKGDVARALALFERQLAMFDELGATREHAVTLGDIARVAMQQGDVARALALHEQALAVFAQAGATRDYAVAVGDIARIAMHQGDAARALALHQQQLATFEELGATREHAVTLGDIGRIVMQQGDVERALALHEQRLKTFDQLGAKYDHAVTLGDVAWIAMQQGHLPRALALYTQQLDTFEQLGAKLEHALALGAIARIVMQQGDVGRALALHEQALAMHVQLGAKREHALLMHPLTPPWRKPGSA